MSSSNSSHPQHDRTVHNVTRGLWIQSIFHLLCRAMTCWQSLLNNVRAGPGLLGSAAMPSLTTQTPLTCTLTQGRGKTQQGSKHVHCQGVTCSM
jgi:hypothetical protein